MGTQIKPTLRADDYTNTRPVSGRRAFAQPTLKRVACGPDAERPRSNSCPKEFMFVVALSLAALIGGIALAITIWSALEPPVWF